MQRVPSPEPVQFSAVERDVVKCPVCSCTFFERVEAVQIPSDHSIIVGQKIPDMHHQSPIYVLRCVRCRELIEPNILFASQDATRKLYDQFLDEMEGKK